MTTYPAPGRGAWTTTGGLLPAKPGSTSKVGYYRLASASETPIGHAWLAKTDTSHPAQCVWSGVKALQGLVGASPDGDYGQDTDQFVRAAQTALGVEVDGIAGRATMRAALNATVAHLAATSIVPVGLLGGLLVVESGLDPAAVGVNGLDHGLAQINLGAHPEVSYSQAMDPEFAISWTGAELSHSHAIWNGRTVGGVDPWDIAVANHNSPDLARQWAMSGAAPVVPRRAFQIAEYVSRVKAAW